jgi:hypothetical protein
MDVSISASSVDYISLFIINNISNISQEFISASQLSFLLQFFSFLKFLSRSAIHNVGTAQNMLVDSTWQTCLFLLHVIQMGCCKFWYLQDEWQKGYEHVSLILKALWTLNIKIQSCPYSMLLFQKRHLAAGQWRIKMKPQLWRWK